MKHKERMIHLRIIGLLEQALETARTSQIKYVCYEIVDQIIDVQDSVKLRLKTVLG